MNEEYYYSENFNENNTNFRQEQNLRPQNYGLLVPAFVLGLASLVFFLFGLNLITAIVAIVLSVMFLAANAGTGNKKGRGMAIIALVSSVLSIIMFIGSWALIVRNLDNLDDMFSDYLGNPELYYEYNSGDDFDDFYNEYEKLLEDNTLEDGMDSLDSDDTL